MNKIGMRYLTLGNIFGSFAKSLAILFMVALIGCTSSSTDDSDDNTPPQEQPSNPDDGDDNSGGGSGSSDNNEQISMEELVANVESAQEVIDPLFEQCETIDDLAKHLDEIKAMECVSEVEIEEETLFIILKGGLRIGWSYHEFPLDSAEDEENGEDDSEEYSSYTTTPPTTSANSDITTRASTEQRDEHTYLKDTKNVGIINLIYSENYESHYINEWFLENAVEDANFKTNNNISSIEKTINTINTSDVIWFVTHGMRFNQQHWFQMDTIEIITDDIKNNLGYYLNENEEYYFSKHFCYIKYKWLPLFTTTWVSESYLKNRISLKNNAIVFCSACSTLQYNKNIANIFTNKGACAYLGYNNSTAKGDKIGRLFIEELLKGKTIQQAYESVPHSDGYATLELHTKSDGVKNYCIVHPKVKTIEKPEVEGASATLEGVVKEWNGNKLLEGTVGFCWSKSEDCKEPTIENDFTDVLDISNSDQEEIEFDTTIEDLEIATEYSYRAYLYINDEYQYGEVKKFNTSNLPTVSTLGADADGLSATLKGITENWHENFSGSVGFCWSKSEDCKEPTIENDFTDVLDISNSDQEEIEFDTTIEGLEPATEYTYRAYLLINDEYFYGNVKSFTTEDDPEAYMKAYLVRLYNDTNGDNWKYNDGWCSNEPLDEWHGVSSYLLNGKRIYNIDLSYNNLRGTINLRGCTALAKLDCTENQISDIDVYGCTALNELYCRSNQLMSLNVSGRKKLEYLDCRNNQLISLNVARCTALKSLSCDHNFLSDLDVSELKALEYLYCTYNILLNLNISGCTSLTEFDCHDNQLTNIDVSSCTELIKFNCYSNPLTSLNILGCTALSHLPILPESLINLNIVNCTSLSFLEIEYDQLVNLQVIGCSSLTLISCHTNPLESLNISGCASLKELDCHDNQLTNLNISGCSALTELSCENNQLINLDVSGCTALEKLYCWGNQLTNLNVSGCSALTELSCGNNQLTNLDISSCKALRELYCSGNKITAQITKKLYTIYFIYDQLYDYHYVLDQDQWVWTKNEYGWYFPGEPSERGHEPPAGW